MIRVVLASDQRLPRCGIARLLREDAGIRVVAETDFGNALRDTIVTSRPDVVILDLSCAGPGSLELLSRIADADTGCPALALSTLSDEHLGVRLFRAGAAGLLSLDAEPAELREVVRHVAGHHRYIPPPLEDRLVAELSESRRGPAHERLSNREFEVLRLTASGLSGTEIAERLDVTPQTVSTYRSRIREKLGLETMAGMIRYAIEHDLAG